MEILKKQKLGHENSCLDTVITCHIGADADAYASLFAASKIYPNSYILWPGTSCLKLQALYTQNSNLLISGSSQIINSFQQITDIQLINNLVVVDTHSLSRVAVSTTLISYLLYSISLSFSILVHNY
jgi:tRNA nucleotidyltransferase (CCA-adding enzyme)